MSHSRTRSWRSAATDDEGLPILDTDGEGVVGWLTHQRLLRAYHAHLDKH